MCGSVTFLVGGKATGIAGFTFCRLLSSKNPNSTPSALETEPSARLCSCIVPGVAFEDRCCPKCNTRGTPIESDQQPGVRLVIFVCPRCRSKWTEATPTRDSREKQSRLTEDEQLAIAFRYTELQSAIHQGGPDVAGKYDALCHVYRGKSNKFLHSFALARNKRHWARLLKIYLSAEIEPQFWPTEEHPY
jgi:hypothetical protein